MWGSLFPQFNFFGSTSSYPAEESGAFESCDDEEEDRNVAHSSQQQQAQSASQRSRRAKQKRKGGSQQQQQQQSPSSNSTKRHDPPSQSGSFADLTAHPKIRKQQGARGSGRAPAKDDNDPSASAEGSLTVMWHQEKRAFRVDLSQDTLKTVKQKIKTWTGVPVNAMRLIHAGALLKDDTSPLSILGLRDGSTLLMQGQKPSKEEMALASSPEEAALLTKIRTILMPLGDIVTTDLPAYRQLFPTPSAGDTPEGQTRSGGGESKRKEEKGNKKKRTEEHARLGEILLQMLLKLDGIDALPGFEEARKQRKAAVKELQAYIDEVDQLYTASQNAE